MDCLKYEEWDDLKADLTPLTKTELVAIADKYDVYIGERYTKEEMMTKILNATVGEKIIHRMAQRSKAPIF